MLSEVIIVFLLIFMIKFLLWKFLSVSINSPRGNDRKIFFSNFTKKGQPISLDIEYKPIAIEIIIYHHGWSCLYIILFNIIVSFNLLRMKSSSINYLKNNLFLKNRSTKNILVNLRTIFLIIIIRLSEVIIDKLFILFACEISKFFFFKNFLKKKSVLLRRGPKFSMKSYD